MTEIFITSDLGNEARNFNFTSFELILIPFYCTKKYRKKKFAQLRNV